MNKALKIAGIVLAVLVGLIVVAVVFGSLRGQLMSGSVVKQNDMLGYEVAPEVALPGSGGMTFNNPLGDSSGSMRSKGYSESAPMMESDSASVPTVGEKKVIKSGNLSLRVDNAEKTGEKIAEIARGNGGEVFSSNFYQGGNKSTKSGTVTVKVPVANFEKAFSEVKKVASLVIRESTSGTDVTEQYVDLEAQLKNKKTEEQAFTRIMEQAQKIQDVLDVQRELSRVRGQIEQLEGKLKYMDSQTEMSTIVVSLTEDAVISITDKWRPWQVAKESVSVLVKEVQNFVDLAIRFVIVALPVLLLYGLVIFVIYKIGRKIYVRFKKKDSVEV